MRDLISSLLFTPDNGHPSSCGECSFCAGECQRLLPWWLRWARKRVNMSTYSCSTMGPPWKKGSVSLGMTSSGICQQKFEGMLSYFFQAMGNSFVVFGIILRGEAIGGGEQGICPGPRALPVSVVGPYYDLCRPISVFCPGAPSAIVIPLLWLKRVDRFTNSSTHDL